MNDMNDTKQVDERDALEVIRESRGAQLRALILAWYTNETYQRALQEQAEALQAGELEISDDWANIADHILQTFSAQMEIMKK